MKFFRSIVLLVIVGAFSFSALAQGEEKYLPSGGFGSGRLLAISSVKNTLWAFKTAYQPKKALLPNKSQGQILVEKSWQIVAAYRQFEFAFAEVNLTRMYNSLLASWSYSAGYESGFSSRNYVGAPKVGVEASVLWYYVSLSALYYNNFSGRDGQLTLRPEIGFTVLRFVALTYGYNIPLYRTGRPQDFVNTHNISLLLTPGYLYRAFVKK